MKTNGGRRNLVVALFVAGAVVGFAPGHAQAQWGMGGFGYGWGGFSEVPKPESFLNQKALIDAQRDTHIPSRDVYANNPNSYINHIRDNGFVERYDVARRDPSYYRYANSPGRSSPARITPTTATVTQFGPFLPLASFYNAENKIAWPTDAPAAGDLKAKQEIFDQASNTVLAETKQSGVASIATVTDARQKLLDYGRPALHYVRAHETPRLADTFHLFLLSLYESLAQAVNPTTTSPADATPTPAPSS
jgi:hypothetical protein